MDSWRTSSYSASHGGNCLECRTDHGRVLLRDTKNRHHGHLDFAPREWAALLAEVKSDRF